MITFPAAVSTSLSNETLMGNTTILYNGSQNAEVLVQAFGVIAEQLACSDVLTRPDHLDRMIAAYVYLFGRISGAVSSAMELIFVKLILL